MPHSLGFVAAVMVACLLGRQAVAAPEGDAAAPDSGSPDANADAQRYSDAAVEAFGAQRYDEAVENFERAFALDKNPNNLFNIGRVYEEAGNLEAAVEHYKKFIAQPGVTLDYRKIALERIDVLEKTIAATKGEPEPKPEPEPEPAPAPTVTEAPTDDTAAIDERRRKQRTAGYVLLGVGAAALIGGGVVGGLTIGANNDLDTATGQDHQDLVHRGNTLTTTADVLYAAGGTLALVGLIVTLTALPQRAHRQTAFTPVFDRNGGGVVLLHRF